MFAWCCRPMLLLTCLRHREYRRQIVKIPYCSPKRRLEVRRRLLIIAVALLTLVAVPARTASAASGTAIQIYGAWHCGNDACTWASVRDLTDFNTKNHWLIDRGDGVPSVNLVVLSFVN